MDLGTLKRLFSKVLYPEKLRLKNCTPVKKNWAFPQEKDDFRTTNYLNYLKE